MSSHNQHEFRRRPTDSRSVSTSFNKAVNRDSRPDPLPEDDFHWDSPKRDRFELLSAYLDGEVTPAEREQVLAWLEHDQTMQCLYARLLKLRRGLQGMPVPPSVQSVDDILAKVEARTQRRPRRMAAAWGGMAIAALFVSAVMGSLTVPGAVNQVETTEDKIDLPTQNASETLGDKALDASTVTPAPAAANEPISPDALMITIDEPVVPIPLAVEPVDGIQSADATEDQSLEAMPEVGTDDVETSSELL